MWSLKFEIPPHHSVGPHLQHLLLLQCLYCAAYRLLLLTHYFRYRQFLNAYLVNQLDCLFDFDLFFSSSSKNKMMILTRKLFSKLFIKFTLFGIKTVVWIMFLKRPTDGSMSSGLITSSSSQNDTSFFLRLTIAGPIDPEAIFELLSTNWAIRLLCAVLNSVRFLYFETLHH